MSRSANTGKGEGLFGGGGCGMREGHVPQDTYLPFTSSTAAYQKNDSFKIHRRFCWSSVGL